MRETYRAKSIERNMRLMANAAREDDKLPAPSVQNLARQMLGALSRPEARTALSPIGVAQAVFALHTALENFDGNPDALYQEGTNICSVLPDIERQFGAAWRDAVQFAEQQNDAKPAPGP